MKHALIAVAAALLLAFTSKPKEWTMVHCYGTPQERDAGMVQALTAVLSGGIPVSGWASIDRNGLYCWEIYMPELPPVQP